MTRKTEHKMLDGKLVRIDTYWSKETIRALCINNALFTKGNNQEYEEMLNMIDDYEPDIYQLYKVAKMICSHSTDDMTIDHIMFLIKNRALTTFYTFI